MSYYPLLFCIIFALEGCSEPPKKPSEPREICSKTEVRTYTRGGTYYECIEKEIGCLKPLKLYQKADGILYCKLDKQEDVYTKQN